MPTCVVAGLLGVLLGVFLGVLSVVAAVLWYLRDQNKPPTA
jgi:hypothetical protein